MRALALAFVVLSAAPAEKLPPLELTDANYAAVYASVQPPENDLRYEKVPWRTTLWSAVVEANQLDKPILLWAMNGHPLGCV